jgi:exopolysaccharide biosynthesis WecB/TagA/CpsF family protein
VELCRVSFRPTGLARLAEAVSTRLDEPAGAPLVIGFVNPHVLVQAREDGLIAQHLNACAHVCVDGIGVVLALRLMGIAVPRVPMHEAYDRLLDTGVLRGRALVIGIAPHDVARAGRIFESRCPGLQVVKTIDGYVSDDLLREALLAVGPVDVVVIGAGSPRSEQLAELVRAEGATRVLIHAGAGTLNAHAGARRHPPALIGRLGLGWLYRYAREPHARQRYRQGIPAFARLVRADLALHRDRLAG